MPKKPTNQISNFYQEIPDNLIRKYHNPNYAQHGIKIPFRLLICGGSGAGKTNTLLELIKRMGGTFESIVICCKSRSEPLYDFLASKVHEGLKFYEDGEIPPINDFKGCGQTLIVFDDLVLQKDQSKIAEFFVRGRKLGEGVSCAYLTQSYYKTPKTIRINCNYLILKSKVVNATLK
jgi:DNA polymerase III delta prime subunit